MPGLSASDVVNVSVTLTPTAIPRRNFGALAIVGPTEGVIDVKERLRQYATLDAVATDFGTSAPEYLAADLFFSQTPQPSICYIGRWAQSATHAWLHGAKLSSAAQNTGTTWNSITNGSIQISIDGTPRSLTGLNFSGATNMNAVAQTIQNALPSGATCTWDASLQRLTVRGIATGPSGTIGYATAVGVGTDISATSGLSAAAGASAPVAGIAAESALVAATALVTQTPDWYGIMFAPTTWTDISTSSYLAVAGYIEGVSPSRILGITSMDAAIVDPTQSGDLASALKALGYNRTFVQYSSSSAYAAASLFGRAFTVDFNANNSTITLKFKQEPGVVAETLSESQAAAADSKYANYFVNYNNGVAITQQGVMSGGWYFDERHGLDWLQNNIQTTLFNIFYTSQTKIPQTDDGVNILRTGVEAACGDGVNNGLIAPGLWTGPSFGMLQTGNYLPKGFYTYVPRVAAQNDSDRAARKAPPIQAAVKLAGAVHSANVLVSVNR